MRRLILSLLLLAASQSFADPGSPTATSVADRYGISNWPKVESIAFTFNVQTPDRAIARKWLWEPPADRVTFTAADGKTTTYVRSDVATSGPDVQEIDRNFINDSYWLIFPFHLVWDSGLTFTESSGPEPLPIGSGEAARRLTAQYSSDVGYTPGDSYDFYLDSNNVILAWAYHKAGAKDPTLVTTWSAPQTYGPLTISLDHEGPGGFRIWFTDVAVNGK